MIVVERVLIFVVALFLFTQMVLPPILNWPMFWLFRRKSATAVRLRLAEERRREAEQELAAAKAEAEALRLEAEAQQVEDENLDTLSKRK